MMKNQNNGKWSQANSIPTQLSKKLPNCKKNYSEELMTSSTSSATSATFTTDGMTKTLGSFRDYQLKRYWDNFDFDLYNRICEIKINTL